MNEGNELEELKKEIERHNKEFKECIERIQEAEHEPTVYRCMDKNGVAFCTTLNPRSKEFKEKFKDIL